MHSEWQHTATHCDTLQHTATRCNTLQKGGVKIDNTECTLNEAARYHTPQHHNATTHYNGLQQHTAISNCHTFRQYRMHSEWQHTATHCNTLQHTATHCNTLQKGGVKIDNTECTLNESACTHSKEPQVHSKESYIHSKETIQNALWMRQLGGHLDLPQTFRANPVRRPSTVA